MVAPRGRRLVRVRPNKPLSDCSKCAQTGLAVGSGRPSTGSGNLDEVRCVPKQKKKKKKKYCQKRARSQLCKKKSERRITKLEKKQTKRRERDFQVTSRNGRTPGTGSILVSTQWMFGTRTGSAGGKTDFTANGEKGDDQKKVRQTG